ncbi:MAG TPA: hypothetical protein VK789_10765 [Bryobacteraceae bacterium]|nr:hypothetical protein [Bryobacteraceae bacterium]
MDAQSIADSLNQLTSGWTPAPGVSQQALNAARIALATSLIAGKSVPDIYAVQSPISGQPPENPTLVTDLLNLATVASSQKSSTIAYIRSARAASAANPSGVPNWARYADVVQSFGPFLDSAGVLNWVNLVRITASTQFAFGSASSPFAVFPIEYLVTPPASATKFNLGAGDIWFLANLLNSTLPAGTFTGFAITGGTLESSAAMSLSSGVYVIPTTATVTVTATLKPSKSPTSTGDPGADAAAATFTPPPSVTMIFTHASAGFSAVAVASAWAYGCEVQFLWSGAAPTPIANQPAVLVPCSSAPLAFAFSKVQSELFIPSGTASITSSGWALPVITATITTLPSAGTGAGYMILGTGASLETTIQPAVAIAAWEMEVSTGRLFIIAGGVEPLTQLNQTTYQLWPLANNPNINATVNYLTSPLVLYSYFARPGDELIVTMGEVVPNIDRPLTATGARFAYGSGALLWIDQLTHETLVAIIGSRPDDPSHVIPLALENAMLGVDAPEGFTLVGELTGGPASTQFKFCAATFYFNMRWLLPTLPDPYAANFNLALVETEGQASSSGTLIGAATWLGSGSDPTVGFLLLPPAQSQSNPAGTTPFPSPAATISDTAVRGPQRGPSGAAMLDLSTRVDLFGVAVAPEIGALLDPARGNASPVAGFFQNPAAASKAAPAAVVAGMGLWLNRALVTTFALPQFSWEPMESTAAGQSGPLACEPASDGFPLLITAPNNQQLVPFQPDLVLLENILAVDAGTPFAGVFSLPFGLDAAIIQPNHLASGKSAFLAKGGRFALNRPLFPNAFPPTPPTATAPVTPPVAKTGPKDFLGAITLSLIPENNGNSNALFPGVTQLDLTGAAGSDPGYGTDVLGYDKTTQATDVGDIFKGEFSVGGSNPGVPLLRIDFSGYGASTFSDWTDQNPTPPAVTKVQFEASIGRTALDVIQVVSVIYPWCIQVVRTITMQRQNAGWILRTDSGWQPASPGAFVFPSSQFAGRMHAGPLKGAYNIRNIRDAAQTFNVHDTVSGKTFEFREVTFDADFALDPALHVLSGGFPAQNVGGPAGSSATASSGVIGYLQLAPDQTDVTPPVLAGLLAQTGAVTPSISCKVEAGKFSAGTSGTVFRCSAFDVDAITQSTGGAPTPSFGVALRGAPQIPNAGGWSMGVRAYTNPAPASLPNNFPVPLVRPATSNNYWYIADVADILQLSQPSNYYSLLHTTGTQKVLFESPQIPTSASISPPPPAPGLQFPKPQPPQSGGAPGNSGSPNLGDLASILNSTGLFPDLTSALSLMVGGATEQINTISQGFQYTKSYQFPAGQTATIVDLSVMTIQMLYAETQQGVNAPPPLPPPTPTTLTYTVNSAPAPGAPSWTLSIGPFTLQVVVPMFGNSPVLWITGGFYGDSHTKPGVTNLNIQFGGILSVVQQVFSALQTVAQFLPGGATANLDVALSDGVLTVQDTFSVADMPLGLGNLTDISLDVGLNVTIQPLSVNFSVGIGSMQNPFNWIATPLAGNGMMALGVQNSQPDFTIQAGIGLGIAIDLGIASGSASITIAFNLNIDGNSLTLMVILTGQASVDVLDGLASASLTLSAGLGISLNPALPLPTFNSGPPEQLTIPSIDIGLLATCSVGIHLTICWVVSVSWDGSWQFRQDLHTPSLTVNL